MSLKLHDNDFDKHVDTEIYDCLNLDNPKSFFLFAGAGSGKTRTLVNVLNEFKKNHGREFRLNRKRVAIITYTNAASNEIKDRLDFDPIFFVSTIHSFAWELIEPFVKDIKTWLTDNLANEILKLQDEQSRSKDLKNKTSVDRARKIESKNKRISNLENIIKFTYNPNGDNITKDSLNHSEVISIAAYFIHHKPLMQELLVCKYPILLIDESQDTKKELIDAFFELQKNKNNNFSLGLFGDTMQRIYFDGKEKLEQGLPTSWAKPVKKMNHRSNKRIITLVNKIREDVDGQEQKPRTDKEEGFVRLFICSNRKDKSKTEESVCNKMSVVTKDSKWNNDDKDVMTLILEHHMAASRMGFANFFEPLYKEEKLKTGVLDGTLSGANFFTKIILPLIEAKEKNDQFAIARIVKSESSFFKKEEFLKNADQTLNIKTAKKALDNLFSLWDENSDPSLIEILQNIYKSNLFLIPNSLITIASRTNDEQKIAIEENIYTKEEDSDITDKIIDAWDLALKCPFSQIKQYHTYLSEESKFGTHQGVKGLEFARVMVILDDEESRGSGFSYDKLFGTKELSDTDKKSIKAEKETGIDKTKRLFYVACSRAKESLAIVAYTDFPEIVKKNVIDYGWVNENEIVIMKN